MNMKGARARLRTENIMSMYIEVCTYICIYIYIEMGCRLSYGPCYRACRGSTSCVLTKTIDASSCQAKALADANSSAGTLRGAHQSAKLT